VVQPETWDCDRPSNLPRSLTGRGTRSLKISPRAPSRPVQSPHVYKALMYRASRPRPTFKRTPASHRPPPIGMIVNLADRGMIRPRPGEAHGIDLLVAPDDLPAVRTGAGVSRSKPPRRGTNYVHNVLERQKCLTQINRLRNARMAPTCGIPVGSLPHQTPSRSSPEQSIDSAGSAVTTRDWRQARRSGQPR